MDKKGRAQAGRNDVMAKRRSLAGSSGAKKEEEKQSSYRDGTVVGSQKGQTIS